MRHREGICWLLLIFNLHNSIEKLKESYGADSMHDQRGDGACFHGRKRECSAKKWEARMVLGCAVLDTKQEEERGLSPLAKKR